MKLCSYSDYAMRVLMYAALKAPVLAIVAEVVFDFGILWHHLDKVVRALGKIILGAVVRLTETSEREFDCMDNLNGVSGISQVCRFKRVFNEACFLPRISTLNKNHDPRPIISS